MSNKPKLIGADFASGPDQQAIAIRSGAHVVLTISADKGAEIDREWINALNAGHRDGRAALALAFMTIAQARGAEVERRNEPINPRYHGQSIVLSFKLNGVGANFDIDNLFGGGYSLVHWYNTEYPVRNFTSKFNISVGDHGLNRPHHKATSQPADWYSLAMYLDAGLMLAARRAALDG